MEFITTGMRILCRGKGGLTRFCIVNKISNYDHATKSVYQISQSCIPIYFNRIIILYSSQVILGSMFIKSNFNLI